MDNPEVRAFVFLNVNGADLHLVKGNALVLEGQQHIGFVLEPVAGYVHQLLHHIPGDGTQAGLGVGDGHSHEQFEDGRGGVVAEAAAGGDVIQGKVPAAQGGVAGLQHVFAAGPGIGGVMLVVPVHGDNAQTLRTVFQEIAERVFQRGSFALVHFMVQQVDFRMLGSQIREIVKVFRLAAVVHQNDMGKPVFQQAVNHGDQLFIRVQRGQYNGNFGQIVQINLLFSSAQNQSS